MAGLAENDDDHDCAVIRPIEEESVQRIVAGQAVTDLASAVKELVDNALDAGGTSINIRLFNQGLDILEVTDDGSGVPIESRKYLAQAHATSKIRSFDDIYSSANSLGFRGEALFCLANLSEKLIVHTRIEEEQIGQKMEFKHDGSLNTESVVPAPRKIGTTVAVVKLLSSLPVRRADLERRIVHHRSKMMRMMEGYAIFSVGVRINLMDVCVKGKETTLLATTTNNRKLEQNISSVLGSKFLSSVAPILVDLKAAVDEASPKGDWKLEGFLSKAPSDQPNNGVKAGQQFFSINGRPVELPKVARTIGDVWRSLGGKKKFSCILTLTLPNQEYDVNLSPEKRQVLLTNEEAICKAIQAGITEFWADQTEGQFTPNASQPASAAPAPAPAPSASNLKPPPPKINDMASLARIQESNRKRARELHAQAHSIAPRKRGGDDDEMDVDSQYGDGDIGDAEGDGDQPAARRAYIRRFKEEQNEQRKLNASQEGASCQYGEENPAAMPEQQQAPPGESPRLRRRGGFVHDISTAKQWERPSSIDKNFKIPPGIEDPDADEEEEETKVPAKRQRTGPPEAGESPVVPANKLSMKDAAALAASFATEDEEEPTRRVTLSLNNEPIDDPSVDASNPTSSGAAKTQKEPPTPDSEKVLWTSTQSRFNHKPQTSPEKEAEVLVKTSSVSSKQASYQTPRSNASKINSHRPQALNLEDFAFRKVDNNSKPSKKSGKLDRHNTGQPKPAVTPEEFTVTPQNDVTKEHNKRSSSISRREDAASAISSPLETDDATTSPSTQVEHNIVWENFSGTDKVVAMAASQRQRMLERKRKLNQVRSEGSGDDEGGRATLAKNKDQKVTLSKQDFSGFTIIGQFNLGFIVAISDSCDLWILDQHACDERRNFERLMNETVMHNQRLIAPMPLELDPWEESCVMDNRELFRKNGFQFVYNEDKPPRHRLSLTTLPHSGARDGRRSVTYGPEDVSALCAILGARGSADDDGGDRLSGGTGIDGSGMRSNNAVRRYAGSSSQINDEADKVITRLPRAVAMFASRACRGSIMVGQSLSKREMEKVLNSMESLSDPWHCAHGRPTTTHISNLHNEFLKDERKVAERISGPTGAMSLSQDQEEG